MKKVQRHARKHIKAPISGKAIIYLRVSSKEQESGYSIPAQLKVLQEHAQRIKLEVVDVIIEIASARRQGRKKFDRMIAFFKKEMKKPAGKRVDHVLTEKTDRLVRNHQDKETLLDLDVTLHMVKERLVVDNDSRSDVLYMFDQHVSNASRYSRNLGEEAAKGMEEKAAEGIYPSKAPIGYVNVTKSDGLKVIEPDKLFAPFVAKMFAEYATGRHSLQTLADMANDELRFAGNNRRLIKSTVAGILANPIYYGEFNWNGERYIGRHRPIISKELFDKVNGVTAANNTQKRQNQKLQWLFQGLFFCGCCGCAMVAEKKKGKYIYYHCTGNKGQNCPNKRKYVAQSTVEAQAMKLLSAIQATDEQLDQHVDIVQRKQESEKLKLQNMQTHLLSKIAVFEKRREELLMRLLDEKIDEARYQQIDGTLQEEVKNLQEQVKALDRKANLFLEKPAQLRQLLANALLLYSRQTDIEKRRLLKFIFARATWRNGQLSPTFNRPFDALATRQIN